MLTLIIWIFLIALIVTAVYKFAPIPEGFKRLIYGICVVWAFILVLNAFGILPSSIPQARLK
jgi:hypothetical protein